MKIGVLQTNPRVGDIKNNTKNILDSAQKGIQLGVQFFVAPELALIGYPPKDLLSLPFLIKSQQHYLNEVIEFSKSHQIAIVLGVATQRKGPGKPFYNSAVYINNGQICGTVNKKRLPNYDVFEEDRFFAPGAEPNAASVYSFQNKTFAISICEDLWNTTQAFGIRDLRSYQADSNPFRNFTQTPDFLIQISASPFWKNKIETRTDLIKAYAAKLSRPVLMVNQVGANDELIFDGSSTLIGSNGLISEKAPSFESGLFVFDLNKTTQKEEESLEVDPHNSLLKALVLGIKDFVTKTGFTKVHLGLSGGIDSALVAFLCEQALGKNNVKGILLPSKFTSQQSITDAENLAQKIGIETISIPIQPLVDNSQTLLQIPNLGLPYENLQSRIRGTLLMGYSNKNNSLLISTGNKSEIAMGYSTLYGDMCGALSPIGDLYKTEVFELCRYINKNYAQAIPHSIIDRPPTAELAPNQKDEDSLPPYDLLDSLLFEFIENQGQLLDTRESWNKKLGPKHSVEKILLQLNKNEFKRSQSAPILKTHLRSFGKSWRFPIAASPWGLAE